MAVPAAIAAGAVRSRALRPWLAALAGSLAAVLMVLLVGVFGAVFGLKTAGVGTFRPSALAVREIPSRYLGIYVQAGQRYGVDPWVLAAIGAIETQHGSSRAPGVRSGVNFAGCCAGPMQFNIRNGPPSTWDAYGVDGNGDGRRSPYEPADAIPAAARYLRANGAPRDYEAALLAYNHANWYVGQVLAKARLYRGGGAPREELPTGRATVGELLSNPRITFSPVQRADLRRGGFDARLIDTLAAIAARHTITVTALRADHRPGTNHELGRAFDLGTVDGEVCRGARTGRCADLVRELARMPEPLRSTELIYCWDPDGPGDPRGFARADHCDHIHVGWDG